MSTFFRNHSLLLGGLGAGILIGVGGSVIYFRLATNVDRELRLLSESIASLQKEVVELKEKIAARKRRSPAFYSSANSSSGETDDEAYEDAYGG
jgi:hypothetical protein